MVQSRLLECKCDLCATRDVAIQPRMDSQEGPLEGEFLESAGHTFNGEPDRTANRGALLQTHRPQPSQHARSVQLRAARDRADVLRDKRRRTQADNRLASVYGCFTEGFEDANLQRHRAWSAC